MTDLKLAKKASFRSHTFEVYGPNDSGLYILKIDGRRDRLQFRDPEAAIRQGVSRIMARPRFSR